MAINIKITGAPDFEALSSVHFQAFTSWWNAQALKDLFAVAGTLAFIADDDETVIGFAVIRAVAGEAELLTLAVASAHRRQGVGHALMQRIIQQMAENGVSPIFLEVGVGNAAAIALYRQCGFVTISRRRDYYSGTGGTSEDAVIMKK